jgi:hypothetical protein
MVTINHGFPDLNPVDFDAKVRTDVQKLMKLLFGKVYGVHGQKHLVAFQ